MARSVTSRVKLYKPKVRELTESMKVALSKTAEALHTEVVQAQVMPFGADEYVDEKVYGKRGQFAKNGREYKGKNKRRLARQGGNLQNKHTFVDISDIDQGKARLVSDTPYARRLYYHPEYKFNKSENPNAGGRWLDMYLPGGKKENFAQDAFNAFYKEETGI